ncbi:hypothetical protein RBSH_02207 [Rhodopirellula baltica SH28]|uniref:Uncharacterized protein n=1 Tax=Rhodopirellula baltica SH28 TaxID=993517 RepID=K5DJF1_RHOBT|nr:hypothetical protein RBSH_02207 [Rhodopirellula baltica SH28]
MIAAIGATKTPRYDVVFTCNSNVFRCGYFRDFAIKGDRGGRQQMNALNNVSVHLRYAEASGGP